MKLLIVTQTVDTQDSVLGFFHRWIAEFAKNCGQVHVLALNVGEYDLPENVSVHCLGKSEGKSKLVWLWRLWWHSWRLRKEYDAVFVHMNPEYVLYGAAVWKLLRKRITMWYAHGSVPKALRIANIFVRDIFTASLESCRLQSEKIRVLGHGIDTDFFSPANNPKADTDEPRFITVGRIAPIKNIEVLLQALKILQDKNILFHYKIVGTPLTEQDHIYEEQLRSYIEENGLGEYVTFAGSATQEQLRDLLREHDIMLHASQTGSLDKVVLEAAATGLMVVSSGVVPCGTSVAATPKAFAEVLVDVAGGEKVACRREVVAHHSLPSLCQNILTYLNNGT